MEYVYTALLLHKAGQKMSAKNMKAVLTAAGVKPDNGRIKALLAALEGVDIEDALKSAAMPMAAAASTTAAPADAPAEEKKEEEEDEGEKEEEVAGLSSLFG